MLHAPRDYDDFQQGMAPRRLYQVHPEVLTSKDIPQDVLLMLDYSEQYRQELAIAFANLYLVHDNAAALSVLFHRPIHTFRDNSKYQHAQRSCNYQNPIEVYLKPILQQLGIPYVNWTS